MDELKAAAGEVKRIGTLTAAEKSMGVQQDKRKSEQPNWNFSKRLAAEDPAQEKAYAEAIHFLKRQYRADMDDDSMLEVGN